MPTEYIGQHVVRYPGDDRPLPDTHLKVCWGRDSEYVQVASLETVQDPDNPYRRLQNCLGERYTIVDSGKSDSDQGYSRHFDGWYMTLETRSQVNDLIRTLRRARDQAFGRDE